MWTNEIEWDIMDACKERDEVRINKYRSELHDDIKLYNYVIARFLDEYGDKFDTDKKVQEFYANISEDFSRASRLLAILEAYDHY